MVDFSIYSSNRTTRIFRVLKHILLLIIWCNENSSVHAISKVKILRSIDGQVDRIRFPRQLCGTTSAEGVGCDVMRKRKKQSCSCTCNVTNPAGSSYVKSTVVYNNGSWQCVDNSQVRQFAGCNTFIGEAITDPIPDITRNLSYVLKLPDQRCRISVLDSAYLKCNGTWKLIREKVLRRFIDTSRNFTEDEVVIKYTGATETHHAINGRVIKLAVSCRKQRQNKHNVGCILIKVKGKLRCPLLVSPKPTGGTKISSVTIPTGKEIKKTDFPMPEQLQPLLVSPKPTGRAKISSVTIPTGKEIKKTDFPMPEQLQHPKIGASKKNVKKRRSGVEDKTFLRSLAVIMGALAVVTLVIVIVSAYVVMVMRRKLSSR